MWDRTKFIKKCFNISTFYDIVVNKIFRFKIVFEKWKNILDVDFIFSKKFFVNKEITISHISHYKFSLKLRFI